jgi:hypothetical protein
VQKFKTLNEIFMGDLKRWIKQFSKPHNSQILKVQVVRVGWRCSYLIKYKKLESPIVYNPVNRRGDFEEWLRSIRLVKKELCMRQRIWMLYLEDFILFWFEKLSWNIRYINMYLREQILLRVWMQMLECNFSREVQEWNLYLEKMSSRENPWL